MKISCFVFNFFKLQTVQRMPYYMNREKLDRYMLTRPKEYMSENRVKPVRHYSVRKREAREFHGSGLTSNHVKFARDVEVSTIVTTKLKAGEGYKEESKIEIQTLHYIDVLSVEFVVQFFRERFRTKFFWRSRRTRHAMTV